MTELTVDRVKVDRVDKVDIIDRVDNVDIIELSLAKPGGGEVSRESVLPASLLACPLGGWPLNLLNVRIVGSVQYKRLAVYSSQKTSLAIGLR